MSIGKASLLPATTFLLAILFAALAIPRRVVGLRDLTSVTSPQQLRKIDILAGVPICPGYPPRTGTLLKVIGPDDTGTVVQIWCAEVTQGKDQGSQFKAIVKKSEPPGFSRVIAKCSYDAGGNAACIFQSPDANGNGRPDCFVTFRWWNDDDGADDDNDGKNDADTYDYDFLNDKLTVVHLEQSSPWQVVSSRTTTVPFTGVEIDDIPDVRAGPLCQMYTTAFNAADIDHDRKVDADDLVAFYSALGSSRGSPNYLPIADLNFDGVVDSVDEAFLNAALSSDTSPPILASVHVTPDLIWPPNNKLVPIIVSAFAVDAVDSAPTWKVIFIENDEELECDPSHPNESVQSEQSGLVRAVRKGKDGRTYRVMVQALDASGNSSRFHSLVTVPHDRR